MRRVIIVLVCSSLLAPILAPILVSILGRAFAAGSEDPAAAENARELAELLSRASQLRRAKDLNGSIDALHAYLDKLPESESPLDPKRASANLSIAENHADLGADDLAIEHTERAVDLGMWNVSRLERNPSFAKLRSTAEFKDLIDRARHGPARMAFGRRDTAGKLIEAKDYAGKVIIIDVWGTWCPPCRKEIPHFIALANKYRAHGLEIIGVTHERREPDERTIANVKSFAKSMGINYRLTVVGRDLIEAVPITKYPTTYFIDHEGKVAKTFVGLQSLYDLEVAAVNLLNQKILADSEAAKRKAAAKEDGGDAKKSTEKAAGSSS